MTSRKRLYTTLALSLVVAPLAIFWTLQAAATWNLLHGAIFGWNVGYDSVTITYLTPGAPAERTGIRVGDRIDWKSLPLLGRANVSIPQVVPSNTSLAFSMSRDGELRAVTLKSMDWYGYGQTTAQISFIGQLLLTIIGIVLVWLRPSRMTWGFLLAGLSRPIPTLAENDPIKFLIVNGFAALLIGVSTFGLLIFISRFPKDRPIGVLAYLDRAALPFGALVAALWLALDLNLVFSQAPPPEWLLFVLQIVVSPLTAITVVVASLVSLTLTTSSDRQRIFPVLGALVFLAIAATALAVYRFSYTGGAYGLVVNCANAAAQVLLAVAVAYGVIRNRVIDLSFAVSRTVVYTVLTSILVGIFALIDFASTKLFEHLGVTLVLEALAALAFGVWVNAIHNRIDGFVDRVLFRRRHLAEERLHRTSRALLHAESVEFIDDALVVEASDALELASAAVFLHRGEAFARTQSEGWSSDDAASIPKDDHLVVTLRSELQAIDLISVRWPRQDVPKDLRHPILAAPLVVRHELLGFVLYGGHTGGEAIDPDERKMLVQLTHAAASAYEHLRAKILATESNTLRAEVALLNEKQALLREMVDALKMPNVRPG